MMKHWVMFWTLGTIWGSSFLLIKVGVEDLGPLPLVWGRVSIAAVFMVVFMRMTGRGWPSGRRERLALVAVGLLNTAIPWTLITWSEQRIDSGLATVLNATVPLFTLALAHFTLSDERITSQKAAGLILGFGGVALLASRDLGGGSSNSVIGQITMLIASVSYALNAIVLRRYLRGVEPFTIAGTSLIAGAIPMTLVVLIAAPWPGADHVHLDAVLAVITLGLFNTVLAYFLFYQLIAVWGATRTTLVTYVMPPIGVTLGALFLDELVDWKIVVGAVLILMGIVVVNWRRPKPQPVAVVSAASCAED
jgi:drug/metabolite transporter (DMT)-like permease